MITVTELENKWQALDAAMDADEAALLAGEIDKVECARRTEKRQAERHRLEELARAVEYFDIDGWQQYEAWLGFCDRALEMAVIDGHPSARYAKILKEAGYTSRA